MHRVYAQKGSLDFRRLGALATMLLLAVLVFVSQMQVPGPFAMLDTIRCIGLSEFDRRTWRAAGEPGGPRRARRCMLPHLLKAVGLQGRTRGDVLRLLGPPDTGSEAQSPTSDLMYLIGAERGIVSFDNEWMGVHFDARGRVNHVAFYIT
jgi:hypothetical protein